MVKEYLFVPMVPNMIVVELQAYRNLTPQEFFVKGGKRVWGVLMKTRPW